jgi:hypothetical protein
MRRKFVPSKYRHGLYPRLFGMAIELWFGCVMAVAVAALKALTSGAVMTSFNLSFGAVAVGTFKHKHLYIVPMLV